MIMEYKNLSDNRKLKKKVNVNPYVVDERALSSRVGWMTVAHFPSTSKLGQI